MNIISATYGNKDVTEIVKGLNPNLIYASNSIFGDPNPGQVKKLNVQIEINGNIKNYEALENTYLSLLELESNIHRLGIFYSNNHNTKLYPCILKSLECIHKASKNKAHIITNVWNSFGDKNPFIETISWFQASSHLNQVLQILQCLYTARQIKNYRYVSFLEHDVLYAEGYFDYNEFDCNIIANMNYSGINAQGFQAQSAKHKPLSQLTMKFDYAIKHFENISKNAILRNDGLLEPQDLMEEWNSKYPSIHVNHGHHFTSHYDACYSKTLLSQYNEYWGSHDNYINLFPKG